MHINQFLSTHCNYFKCEKLLTTRPCDLVMPDEYTGEEIKNLSVVPRLYSEMDSEENLSIDNSLLYVDNNDFSLISSVPESLPTFQMFREKKIKVEEEMKYSYRVMLGGGKQPIHWLVINKSHIEDWEIQFQNDYAEVSRNDEDITDLFIKCADERISILLGKFAKA